MTARQGRLHRLSDDVIYYIKIAIYIIVLICYFPANSGSFEDFFAAIRADDPATVSRLLRLGFDPNTRDAAGQHPLHLAVREKSVQSAAVLIAWKPTDVEPRTVSDESPLMLAALQGMRDTAARLIDRGADVNKPGWTPLHYAATNGHVALIRLLLEHHAYIDAASPNASTPLMMAAFYGSPAAVKLLLECGADPMLQNDQGLSALDFANRNSRVDAVALIAAFVREGKPAPGCLG